MTDREEAPSGDIIGFVLSVSEFGATRRIKLRGVVDRALEKGILVATDYPLEPGHVLQFDEKVAGHSVGIVKRSLKHGKTYMVHIDFK